MKIRIFIFISTCIWTSCLIQLVNTNSYDELESDAKGKIAKLESFNDLNDDKVYELTASELLGELKTKEKSLVYIYTNGCSSENCLPLSTVQEYAENNDLKAYLIMDGYHLLNLSLDQKYAGPLFSIDANHYGSLKKRHYLKKFREGLGYYKFLEQKNEKWLGSYYFFEYDSLVDIKMQLN